MYCINCGVKLQDGAEICPLCETKVPVKVDAKSDDFYPQKPEINQAQSSFWFLMILSFLFLLPIVIMILCDVNINGGFTWSGYAVGALVSVYLIFVLPFWFKNPNPVIFVPTSFVTIALYLLLVNLLSKGDWFLSFAFPVTAIFGVIASAFATLMKYLRRGRLYIYGGVVLAVAASMPLTEFFLNLTFSFKTVYWSMYPLTTLFFLGALLIFLGISKPAREALERKFFF